MEILRAATEMHWLNKIKKIGTGKLPLFLSSLFYSDLIFSYLFFPSSKLTYPNPNLTCRGVRSRGKTTLSHRARQAERWVGETPKKKRPTRPKIERLLQSFPLDVRGCRTSTYNVRGVRRDLRVPPTHVVRTVIAKETGKVN